MRNMLSTYKFDFIRFMFAQRFSFASLSWLLFIFGFPVFSVLFLFVFGFCFGFCLLFVPVCFCLYAKGPGVPIATHNRTYLST